MADGSRWLLRSVALWLAMLSIFPEALIRQGQILASCHSFSCLVAPCAHTARLWHDWHSSCPVAKDWTGTSHSLTVVVPDATIAPGRAAGTDDKEPEEGGCAVSMP